MKPALYTVTHKATRNVLGVCSFEKQVLADQDARDALRERLVADKLPIAMSTHGPGIEVPGTDLAIDEIEIDFSAIDPIVGAPYLYHVKSSLTDPAKPGDGSPKTLELSSNSLFKVELQHTGSLTIELTNAPQPTADIFVVFEGEPPRHSQVTTPNKVVVVPVPPVTAGNYYGMLLVITDVPVSPLLVKAT
jgi:hypothetical protein